MQNSAKKHSPTQLPCHTGCELKRKGSQGAERGTEKKEAGVPREKGSTDILKRGLNYEKDQNGMLWFG